MHRLMRRIAFVGSLLLCGALAAPSAASAEAQSKEAAAEEAAGAWLKLVDGGRYAESWAAASSLFRNAVPKEQWTRQVGAARGPLGAVVKRQVKSRQHTTTLPGAPDGEYVVIQYETSFANKKSAVETVTPMLDHDGKWRVSGYFVR